MRQKIPKICFSLILLNYNTTRNRSLDDFCFEIICAVCEIKLINTLAEHFFMVRGRLW